MSQFIYETRIKMVNKIAKMAFSHDGRLYGNYLRNVILPRLKDPLLQPFYNFVTFQFPSLEKKDAFVQALRSYNIVSISTSMIDCEAFELNVSSNIIASINCVVTDQALNIDQLYYTKKDQFYDHTTQCYYGKTELDQSPIYQSIVAKQLVLLPEFSKLYEGFNSYYQWDILRILCSYLKDGWTIQYQSINIKIPILNTRFFINLLKNIDEPQTKSESEKVETEKSETPSVVSETPSVVSETPSVVSETPSVVSDVVRGIYAPNVITGTASNTILGTTKVMVGNLKVMGTSYVPTENTIIVGNVADDILTQFKAVHAEYEAMGQKRDLLFHQCVAKYEKELLEKGLNMRAVNQAPNIYKNVITHMLLGIKK